MDAPLRAESLKTRFAPYIEELHGLFGRSHIRFGSAEDVGPLAAAVSIPGSFQDDLSAMVRSIVYRENTEITSFELLRLLLVAVAGAGTENRLGELSEPAGQLLAFIRGASRVLRSRAPDESRTSELETDAPGASSTQAATRPQTEPKTAPGLSESSTPEHGRPTIRHDTSASMSEAKKSPRPPSNLFSRALAMSEGEDWVNAGHTFNSFGAFPSEPEAVSAPESLAEEPPFTSESFLEAYPPAEHVFWTPLEHLPSEIPDHEPIPAEQVSAEESPLPQPLSAGLPFAVSAMERSSMSQPLPPRVATLESPSAPSVHLQLSAEPDDDPERPLLPRRDRPLPTTDENSPQPPLLSWSRLWFPAFCLVLLAIFAALLLRHHPRAGRQQPMRPAAGPASTNTPASKPSAYGAVLGNPLAPANAPAAQPSAGSPDETSDAASAGSSLTGAETGQPQQGTQAALSGETAGASADIADGELDPPLTSTVLQPPAGAKRSMQTGFSSPAPEVRHGLLVVSAGLMNANLVSAPAPEYPMLARMAHVEGQVILKTIVARNGAVVATHALQGHHLLRGAAQKAVRRWRYRPYLVDGRPAKVQTIVFVEFRLHH